MPISEKKALDIVTELVRFLQHVAEQIEERVQTLGSLDPRISDMLNDAKAPESTILLTEKQEKEFQKLIADPLPLTKVRLSKVTNPVLRRAINELSGLVVNDRKAVLVEELLRLRNEKKRCVEPKIGGVSENAPDKNTKQARGGMGETELSGQTQSKNANGNNATASTYSSSATRRKVKPKSAGGRKMEPRGTEPEDGNGHDATACPSSKSAAGRKIHEKFAAVSQANLRVLVVGLPRQGKTALINRVLYSDHKRRTVPRNGEITTEFISAAQKGLVLHEFVPGQVACDFINIRQRSESKNHPERLHAIWLCIETWTDGHRCLDNEECNILRLAQELNTPVFLVFTKYDALIRKYDSDAHAKVDFEDQVSRLTSDVIKMGIQFPGFNINVSVDRFGKEDYEHIPALLKKTWKLIGRSANSHSIVNSAHS
ncbi:hypothetical protein B0H14DRAFT_3132364 [Mycena olivaceomarginata]|nr:hypothetical protein B0H14DRAFT_3132364 [Mycena olivaceomarginata]